MIFATIVGFVIGDSSRRFAWVTKTGRLNLNSGPSVSPFGNFGNFGAEIDSCIVLTAHDGDRYNRSQCVKLYLKVLRRSMLILLLCVYKKYALNSMAGGRSPVSSNELKKPEHR